MPYANTRPQCDNVLTENVFEIITDQGNWSEVMSLKFAVNTVPADGLAPLGARTSAGTKMTKLGVSFKLDSYFLTSSTRVYARLRHAGQHRGTILRRADALWIISMNIRAYTRANYHGVYIRWLRVTLANAFDWIRYQRRPWKFN